MADLCTIMTIYLHLSISSVRYTTCYSMFSAIQEENRFWSMWNGFEILLGEGTINCPSGTQEDASSEQVKQHSACLQALKSFNSAENEASRRQSTTVEGSFPAFFSA